MVLFGTVLENAAQEMVKRGTDREPRWERKYRMSQLLTAGFVLTNAESTEDELPAGALHNTDDGGMLFDEVA